MQQEHGDEVPPETGPSRPLPVAPGQAMPLQLDAHLQVTNPTGQQAAVQTSGMTDQGHAYAPRQLFKVEKVLGVHPCAYSNRVLNN